VGQVCSTYNVRGMFVWSLRGEHLLLGAAGLASCKGLATLNPSGAGLQLANYVTFLHFKSFISCARPRPTTFVAWIVPGL
jgi:hypothetical protein